MMLVLLLVTVAHAKHVIYTFDEIVEESEIVIVGEVARVKKSLLGRKYAMITPVQFIKGSIDISSIIVEYDQPFYLAQEDTTVFSAGEKHVLFLRKYDKHFYLVGAQSGQYSIDNDGYVCYYGETITLQQFIEEINKRKTKGSKR